MGKTALDLSQEEWQAYRPGIRTVTAASSERLGQAWEVARRAARLLRQRFGATRVVVFGSLAHDDRFTQWSDIDLAAWGISADVFYKAVASVTGLSSQFKVDLVDPEDCRPDLRQAIKHEGVAL